MTANQGMITGGGAPYGLDREQANDHRTTMVVHPAVAHPVVPHLFRGGEEILGNITNPTAEAVGHPGNSEGNPQQAVGHPAVGAFEAEDNPYPAGGQAGVEFNAEYRYLNAATCPDCGSGMVRLGGCFSCPACGFSSCEI